MGATGRVKVYLRPPSVAFSTAMVPRMASNMRRTSGRPSPKPPFLRERPKSTL